MRACARSPWSTDRTVRSAALLVIEQSGHATVVAPIGVIRQPPARSRRAPATPALSSSSEHHASWAVFLQCGGQQGSRRLPVGPAPSATGRVVANLDRLRAPTDRVLLRQFCRYRGSRSRRPARLQRGGGTARRRLTSPRVPKLPSDASSRSDRTLSRGARSAAKGRLRLRGVILIWAEGGSRERAPTMRASIDQGMAAVEQVSRWPTALPVYV